MHIWLIKFGGCLVETVRNQNKTGHGTSLQAPFLVILLGFEWLFIVKYMKRLSCVNETGPQA